MAQQNQVTEPQTRLYVFVGVFSGLVEQVRVFSSLKNAEMAFETFCSIHWRDVKSGVAEINYKFEDSDIYEVEME